MLEGVVMPPQDEGILDKGLVQVGGRPGMQSRVESHAGSGGIDRDVRGWQVQILWRATVRRLL